MRETGERVIGKSSKRQANDGEEQQETGEWRRRARDRRATGESKRQASDGEGRETDRGMTGKSDRETDR